MEGNQSRKLTRRVAVIAVLIAVGVGAAKATVGGTSHRVRSVAERTRRGAQKDVRAAMRQPVSSSSAPTQAGPYDPTLSPSSGPAGTTVTVSGGIPQLGEGGNTQITLTDLPVWWNIDPTYPSQDVHSPAPAGPGRLLELLDMKLTQGQMRYESTFQVPTVAPGTYPVGVLQNAKDGSVASLGSSTFTVTG